MKCKIRTMIFVEVMNKIKKILFLKMIIFMVTTKPVPIEVSLINIPYKYRLNDILII